MNDKGAETLSEQAKVYASDAEQASLACCGGGVTEERRGRKSASIEDAVKEKYGAVARGGLSSEQAGVRAVAEAFGYSPEELSSIPAEANMGLSCGNPTAYANLRAGETVVDLGSGGGLDVFLAAERLGPKGRAIGIDMTPEMVELARRNAEKTAGDATRAKVEFHLSTIDDLPLEDASVDCVISNCVINLAVNKQKVFREIARVLKPGGRLAVSDIALKKPLPPELGANVLAYVGCVAGAISIEDYKRGLIEAGFAHVEVVDGGADLNAYGKAENQTGCCGSNASLDANLDAKSACVETEAVGAVCCAPGVALTKEDAALHENLSDLLRRYDVNEYAASVKVYAVKPV